MAETRYLGSLRIGAVARQTGVSPDTLRHYERKGLLPMPVRSAGGYRQYPLSAVGRVRTIRCALAIGFSLDELSKVLRMRDSGGAPCQSVRSLAAQKLETLEQRLRELKALKRLLEGTLRDWDERLLKAVPGQRLGLLDSFALKYLSARSLLATGKSRFRLFDHKRRGA